MTFYGWPSAPGGTKTSYVRTNEKGGESLSSFVGPMVLKRDGPVMRRDTGGIISQGNKQIFTNTIQSSQLTRHNIGLYSLDHKSLSDRSKLSTQGKRLIQRPRRGISNLDTVAEESGPIPVIAERDFTLARVHPPVAAQ